MKLPDITADRLQAPQPSGQVVVADTSAVPQAIAGFGKTVSEIGEMVHRVQQRRNTEAAEAAFTAARQEQIDLASGEDGYQNKLGKDALSDTFHKDYKKRFDDRLGRISDGLQNDDQRELFKARADISRMQVSEGLLTHTMRQDEAVFKANYAATNETEQKFAVINALNPTELGLSRVRVMKNVDMMAERLGMPKEVADAEKRKQLSGMHEAVVNTMIQGGYDLAAQQYATSDTVKADLTDESQILLTDKIKAATTDGKAARATDEIWLKFGPTKQNDPVRVFDMEQEARKQLSGDQRALDSAIKEIRTRAAGFNAQQAEVTASNTASVMGMYNEGTSLMNIKKSPEFLALTGTQQTSIIEHITDRGYTMKQRAAADKASLENNDNWEKYWELTKPGVLDGMTEAQVQALSSTIGWPMTNKLMEFKRGKSLPATIDSDTFNRIMMDSGLDPYSKNKSERANMGRMRDRIESEIAKEQKRQGGKLSREEAEKIAKREADITVMQDVWGSDKEVMAGTVKPEQRKSVYVPMEKISDKELAGMINLMRSRGRIPEGMNDKEAKDKYKESLQKAYGRFTAGGSTSEVLEALDGR